MKKKQETQKAKPLTVKEYLDLGKMYVLKQIKWAKADGKSGFKYLAGINRTVIPSHVTKLVASLMKLGIIRPIIVAELSFITGKVEKYIIDGQHLFNALLRVGLDIPYVTVKIDTKEELVEGIALLNASSKSWSLQDYVTAWGSLKNDYVKLNHYFQVYDIEFSIVAAILAEYSVVSGHEATKNIKRGTFKIANEKSGVETLNYLNDVLNVLGRLSRYENRYACNEFLQFIRSEECYNAEKHKVFIEKLKEYIDLVQLAVDEHGKLVKLFKQIFRKPEKRGVRKK